MIGKKEHIIGIGSVIFIGLCILLFIVANDKSSHHDSSSTVQNQISVSLTSETIITKIDSEKIITPLFQNLIFSSYTHSKVEIYDQKINQWFSSASKVELRFKPFKFIRSFHYRPKSIEDIPVLS